MTAEFLNVYDDRARAEAYAKLQFPGTYHLAYRDLPTIIGEHVRGRTALDFGCGTGRSTRFLRSIGFSATGVDISEHMLAQARQRDPEGEYRRVPDGDLGGLMTAAYDLVLSAFTFDNVPTMEKKVALLSALRRLLRNGGRIVNLVSAPDIYVNEWAHSLRKTFLRIGMHEAARKFASSCSTSGTDDRLRIFSGRMTTTAKRIGKRG